MTPCPSVAATDGMTEEQIEVVKATVPVIQFYGRSISERFYALLLEAHPNLRTFFEPEGQPSGERSQRLADAMLAYAQNVEQVEVFALSIAEVARQHCCLHVASELNPAARDAFLRSARAVLGEAAQPEILDAWAAAYDRLARSVIPADRASNPKAVVSH